MRGVRGVPSTARGTTAHLLYTPALHTSCSSCGRPRTDRFLFHDPTNLHIRPPPGSSREAWSSSFAENSSYASGQVQ